MFPGTCSQGNLADLGMRAGRLPPQKAALRQRPPQTLGSCEGASPLPQTKLVSSVTSTQVRCDGFVDVLFGFGLYQEAMQRLLIKEASCL